MRKIIIVCILSLLLVLSGCQKEKEKLESVVCDVPNYVYEDKPLYVKLYYNDEFIVKNILVVENWKLEKEWSDKEFEEFKKELESLSRKGVSISVLKEDKAFNIMNGYELDKIDRYTMILLGLDYTQFKDRKLEEVIEMLKKEAQILNLNEEVTCEGWGI